jgi:hypothetical protein
MSRLLAAPYKTGTGSLLEHEAFGDEQSYICQSKFSLQSLISLCLCNWLHLQPIYVLCTFAKSDISST